MVKGESTIAFADLKNIEGLEGPKPLDTEEYREYDMPGRERAYRIYSPIGLYYRIGGGTHRVVDSSGVVHLVPFGQFHGTTVVRWKNREGNPVNW